MPKCFSSTPVWRVSSAAIKETLCNISRARTDRSPRLPIGVATTYRRPADLITIIYACIQGSGAEEYGSDLSTSTPAAVRGAHGIAGIGRMQPDEDRAGLRRPAGARAAARSRGQARGSGAGLRAARDPAAGQCR